MRKLTGTVVTSGDPDRYFEQRIVYENDWASWGWTDDPTSIPVFGGGIRNDTPYCILAESFSVLERAAANAPADRFVLREAYDYVWHNTTSYVPSCKEGGTNANSGVPDWATTFGRASTRLFDDFFEESAGERAAIMLHEAWHRGTSRMHTGKKGEDGLSRDRQYRNIYADGEHLGDGGVSTYSIHVAWIEDYIRLPDDTHLAGRATIDAKNREQALARANRILQSRFVDPTSKRLTQFTAESVINAPRTTALADPSVEFGVEDVDGGASEDRTKVLGALSGEKAGSRLYLEACGLIGLSGSFREKGDYVKIIEKSYAPDGTYGRYRTLVAHTEQTRESRKTGLCVTRRSRSCSRRTTRSRGTTRTCEKSFRALSMTQFLRVAILAS